MGGLGLFRWKPPQSYRLTLPGPLPPGWRRSDGITHDSDDIDRDFHDDRSADDHGPSAVDQLHPA